MKYLVGMSGGLDSTYVAYLLKSQGHDVEGATLIMHDHTEVEDARKGAAQVGVPLHEIDCRARFEEKVIENFVTEYQKGRTPNPCILCNRYVKVGALCDFATQNGFDAVVTGHYAKIGQENGRYFVLRAEDMKKDQSYVLWRLTQEQLALLQTPLYGMQKEEIRARAKAIRLHAAEKKESQDICFLPNGDYVSFVESRVGKMESGNFVLPDGSILGKHKGLLHYTVGQRKGLGIAYKESVFVSKIDAARNEITVTPSGGEYATACTVNDLVFQAFEVPTNTQTKHLRLKLRYGAPLCWAEVTYDSCRASVRLDEPQRAITPGQSAVFYDGDRVAFGGVIE